MAWHHVRIHSNMEATFQNLSNWSSMFTQTAQLEYDTWMVAEQRLKENLLTFYWLGAHQALKSTISRSGTISIVCGRSKTEASLERLKVTGDWPILLLGDSNTSLIRSNQVFYLLFIFWIGSLHSVTSDLCGGSRPISESRRARVGISTVNTSSYGPSIFN